MDQISSCSLCRRRKLRCNRENPCSNCARSRNGTCIYEDPSSQLVQKRIGLDQQNAFDSARDPHRLTASKSGTSTSTASIVTSTASRSTSAASPIRSAASPSASTESPIIGLDSVTISHRSHIQTTSSSDALTRAGQLPSVSTREVDSIRSQIRQLEERLSRITQGSARPAVQPLISDTEISTAHIGGTLTAHAERRFSDQDERVLSVTRSLTHKNRLFGQSHWVNGITMVSMCHLLTRLKKSSA